MGLWIYLRKVFLIGSINKNELVCIDFIFSIEVTYTYMFLCKGANDGFSSLA